MRAYIRLDGFSFVLGLGFIGFFFFLIPGIIGSESVNLGLGSQVSALETSYTETKQNLEECSEELTEITEKLEYFEELKSITCKPCSDLSWWWFFYGMFITLFLTGKIAEAGVWVREQYNRKKTTHNQTKATAGGKK